MIKTQVPKVSVVMSVYNGEDYLEEALKSLFAQTFKDFECIVINDGSTDKTAEILASFNDSRLKVLEQENKGLVDSLNRGIKEAKGKFIARHDADDMSVKDRIAKQISFLEQNPHVVIVGSSIQVMNDAGKVKHSHYVLLDDPELRQELFVRSPFAHGSVMYRRDTAIKAGLYRKEYWPIEDYDLWVRISKEGDLANIDEPLYVYREHEESISSRNNSDQNKLAEDMRDYIWKNRKQFYKSKRIQLKKYKLLVDGSTRENRIIENIRFVITRANKEGSLSFALKQAKLLSGNPVIYRRLLGTMKRKVLR